MTLALTMIVKNESDVLARVLDGVRGVVDEIVIVDTGSTDATADVARRYTDKVYDFEWRDDFSAARNYALSKTSADYFLWLDADDVVPKRTARGIAELKKTLSPDVDVVMLPYVLARDGKGKPSFSFYRERIVRNRPDFTWRGKVHEAVDMHGNISYAELPIDHAKPSGRTSGTRNLDIYLKMLARGESLTPRERYYYARELFSNDRTREAAAELELFISGAGGFTVNKADACVMLSRCYAKLNRPRDALDAALAACRFTAPTSEACCEIGSRFFELGDLHAAAFWYESALRVKPDTKSGAFVCSDYRGIIPLVWLTVCYDRLGDIRSAYGYHRRAVRIAPDHPSVVQNSRYFERLGLK